MLPRGRRSMKILVISLAGIGDTLMATPLIHEVRLNFPEAVVEAFVMWPGSREVLEGNPHLHAVHQRNILREGFGATLEFTSSLRARRYDLSFNTYPQSRLEYRVVARLIDARQRLAHRYDNPLPFDPLLVTDTVAQDYHRHAVENNLALLAPAHARPRLVEHTYELFLTDAEHAWAEDFLVRHHLEGQPLLGLHVGSGRTKNLALRRWPLDCFADLARQLLGRHPNLAILLFGGPEERDDHTRLLGSVHDARVRSVDAPGLRPAAALLARCRSFLSVDTVLMHLAAAVRVPHQVVIETPTFNRTVEPLGQRFTLVPNPLVAGRNLSYYRYDGGGIRGSQEHLEACMRSVTVEAVVRALETGLEKGS